MKKVVDAYAFADGLASRSKLKEKVVLAVLVALEIEIESAMRADERVFLKGVGELAPVVSDRPFEIVRYGKASIFTKKTLSMRLITTSGFRRAINGAFDEINNLPC